MSPLDILAYVRSQPFVPFRLVVSDGTNYDITHPELCLVAQTTVTVSIPSQFGGGPAADHLVDAFHIVKLIPLGSPAGGSGTNGTPGV